jgi:hypothetical protein
LAEEIKKWQMLQKKSLFRSSLDMLWTDNYWLKEQPKKESKSETRHITKKVIKSFLEWFFLNINGLRHLSGGYAIVTIDEILNDEDDDVNLNKVKIGDIIYVLGHVRFGEQDMGGGGSVEYMDEFDIPLEIIEDEEGKIKVKRKKFNSAYE